MELQTEVKERLHIINKINKDWPNLYAYIHLKFSLESENEIKRDVDFATFSMEADTLALYQAINKTHLVSVVSSSNAMLRRNELNEYTNCTQGVFEGLFEFKERFSMKYKSYETQDNAAKDDEDQAIDRLEALD